MREMCAISVWSWPKGLFVIQYLSTSGVAWLRITHQSPLCFASIFDSYFWSCFVRLCFPFLLRLFVLWFLEQRLKLRLFCKPFLPALLQLSLLGAALWATWGLHPLQGFVLFSSVMLFRVNIHWGNNTVEDVTVAKSIFQVLPPVCFYGQG